MVSFTWRIFYNSNTERTRLVFQSCLSASYCNLNCMVGWISHGLEVSRWWRHGQVSEILFYQLLELRMINVLEILWSTMYTPVISSYSYITSQKHLHVETRTLRSMTSPPRNILWFSLQVNLLRYGQVYTFVNPSHLSPAGRLVREGHDLRWKA